MYGDYDAETAREIGIRRARARAYSRRSLLLQDVENAPAKNAEERDRARQIEAMMDVQGTGSKFAMDLRQSFLDYGNLSEKQWAWVAKLSDTERKAQQDAERQEKADAQAAADAHFQFVGEPKQRLRSVPVTVRRCRDITTQYGESTIVEMASDDALFIWWATNVPEGIEEGATVTVDATVKGHKVYRSVNQTNVNRVRVVA